MAKSRVKKTECPNCGYKLSQAFNYCPSCGQENHTHKLPFKHFVGEFLETLFHFDNKLLVTLRDLFIPGRMTVNYNQNKRGRYVPPIRLYIFITFIFFLILSLSSKLEKQLEEGESGDSDSTLISVNVFGIEADTAWYNKIRNSQEPDKLINEFIHKEYPESGWVMKKMIRNLLLINTGHVGKEELMHKLHKAISGSMFVLMPVFAFFLWLFYWRKKIFYSEHLVFSLHFHTLLFIIFTLWLLLNLVNLHIGLLFLAAILSYLMWSLKNVHQQGWMKTTMKFLLITGVYSLSILFILLTGFLFSFLIV
ncbi:MAG: DUF3667 domain-containing protein [Bacteroidales bacterium]|nr:DUF3667 domain-containing protein [Bacteroidales bacterium]